MDRLKYLCNYSHDLISFTRTIPTFLLAFQNYQKQKTLYAAQIEPARDPFKKKKIKIKEKRKKKPSSPSLTPLYFFKRDQLLHFFLRSQSTPARTRINLHPPPPLCIPYTIHTHDQLRIFDRNLSVGTAAMVLIGLDTGPSFRALRETKGVDCERGTKNPGHPFEKRNKQEAQGGRA